VVAVCAGLLVGCVVEVGIGDSRPPAAEGLDADGDGYAPDQGDCDDDSVLIGPAPIYFETCDGLDNDCNGTADDADVCFRSLTIRQQARLDLLFVVHDGFSMGDVQDKLTAAMSDFVAYARPDSPDLQVGVLTARPVEGLGLQSAYGLAWLDASVPDASAVDWLEDAVSLGVDNGVSEPEQRSALLEALDDLHRVGMLRRDVPLHAILVADAEDSSLDGVDVLLGRLEAEYGATGATVHAIVPGKGCGSPAHDTLEMAQLTGGTVLSSCAEDYGSFLAAVAQVAVGDSLVRRIELQDPAVPETIRVTVRLGGHAETLSPDEVSYDGRTHTVILAVPPPHGADIELRYEADSAVLAEQRGIDL
jgi:hypothetical protein